MIDFIQKDPFIIIPFLFTASLMLIYCTSKPKKNCNSYIKTITQYSGKEAINQWETEGPVHLSGNHVSFVDKKTNMPVCAYGTLTITRKHISNGEDSGECDGN